MKINLKKTNFGLLIIALLVSIDGVSLFIAAIVGVFGTSWYAIPAFLGMAVSLMVAYMVISYSGLID